MTQAIGDVQDAIRRNYDKPLRHTSSVSSKFLLTMLALVFNMMLVFFVNPHSVLGYLYFLFLTIVLYRLLVGHRNLEPISLYTLYTFAIIVLYLLQLWSYPEYFGFSGGLGIGTDDAKFYSQVAESLPAAFPIRGGDQNIHEYSRLLRFVSWLPITHPLDILFFNAMGLVFIPIFTREVAFLLTRREDISKRAYKLVMICPFLLANSLILMRDGWVTMAAIGAVFFFLKTRYIKMGLLLALLFYLRIGSALLLVFVLSFFVIMRLYNKRQLTKKAFYIIALFIVLGSIALFLYPTVHNYLIGKQILGDTLFFRERGVSYSMAKSVSASDNEDSLTYAIYQQPSFLRIPLGFLVFFVRPWFVPGQIIKQGIFRPRAVMDNLFAVLFVFYLGYFVRAFFAAMRDQDQNLKLSIFAYLAAILVLSQLSIQSRHKTMMLPLFYIIVAYGYYQRTKPGERLGMLGAFILVVVQVGRILLRLI